MTYFERIEMKPEPVEKEPDKVMQTPFGEALVQDWRDPHNIDLGRVTLRSPIINGVSYKEIDVYLVREEYPAADKAMTRWTFNQFDKQLTNSAKLKIEKWLHENAEQFSTLRSPLTEEDAKRLHKSRVRSRTLAALTRLRDEGFTDADLDEALQDAVRISRSGKGYKQQWTMD